MKKKKLYSQTNAVNNVNNFGWRCRDHTNTLLIAGTVNLNLPQTQENMFLYPKSQFITRTQVENRIPHQIGLTLLRNATRI